MVCRRRRDSESDGAREGVVWTVCARDDPHLQGRELPQEAGLRDHRDSREWNAGAEGDGAGRGESLVVAVADDAWSERHQLAQHRGADALAREAEDERRAPPAIRGYHSAAGGSSW